MSTDLRRSAAMAVLLMLGASFLAGCEAFVADGDEAVGVNERGGYFYMLDNEVQRLVMLDRKLTELHSWPYSDFTSESYVQGLTIDGSSLWVAVAGGDDAVYQLDLGTGASIETLRALPAPPDGQGTVRDIAWDGEVLWVLNSGSATYGNPSELFSLDPTNGTVLTRRTLPSPEPRGMCAVGPNADVYGSGAIEGLYYTDKDDDFVYVFDTARSRFLDAFAAPVGPRGANYVYPLGIFFDGSVFWTTNSSGVADYLFGLDAAGEQLQRFDLPYEQPGALVWSDHDLRVAAAPVVEQVSPNTGGPTAHKTVHVFGLGFRDGLTADFGASVAVDSLTYVGSTEFIAYITIAVDADRGARSVTVTNPDGQQGVGVGLFSVVDFDPSTGYLWFLDAVNGLLYRYSVNDRAVAAIYDPAPVAPGGSLQGLAFDGVNLWLAAAGSDDIVARIDTTGGDITGLASYVAPPGATGTVRDMAFDGTHLWVPNSGSDEIYRMDPADGAIVETIPTPGGETRGVAWADGALYCNDKDTDTVYVWDAGTATWTAAFETPVPPGGTTANRYPTGMTWDGLNFWICNSTGEFDYILQVSPDGALLGTIEVPERGDAQPSGIVFTRN